MKNISIFFKTYWLHSRSSVELFIFIIGLVSMIWGKSINLPYQIGIGIIVISLIYASYRTWLYEHNKFSQVYQILHDINDIQLKILQIISKKKYKKIIVHKNLNGMNIRCGDSNDELAGYFKNLHVDELISSIEDLSKKDLLVKDLKSDNYYVYSLSKNGFDYLKLLEY